MAAPKSEELLTVTRAVSLSDMTGTTAGVALDKFSHQGTGDPTEPVQRSRPKESPSQSRKRFPSQLPSPEIRAAIRTHWKAAKVAAERMALSARDEDATGQMIAADDLSLALAKLWDLRAARDINWQTIINHTQGMLEQFFAEEQVESLTPEQCGAIHELVDRYLNPATKTVEDLNEAVRLIEDAGFDPYGAISGDPEDAAGE